MMIPTDKITNPIVLYAFLYIFISAETFTVSFSAMGLYILAIIAFAIPKSAILRTCKIELYNPPKPRYSSPNDLIKIVRTINGNNISTTRLTMPTIIFRTEFFVLSFFIFTPT